MTEQEDTQNSKRPDARNLPALLPPGSLVLRRAEMSLGLLREVVQESSAEYWYERGKKESAAQEWERAAYAFEQCIKLDGSHRRGAMQLARALVHTNHLFKAAKVLQQSCNGLDDPSDELTNEQWKVLEIEFTSNSSLANKSYELLQALALVYFFIYDWDGARQVLDDTRFGLSESSALWNKMSGSLRFVKGDFDTALAEFDQAIAIEPDCATFLWRGDTKRELQDNFGACEDYSQAIALNPLEAAAYHMRGHAKGNLLDYKGALADYDRSIELKPDNFLAYDSPYMRRARCKEKLDDFQGALEDYSLIIDKNSNRSKSFNSNAYLLRGRCKMRLGDWLGAIVDFDRRIEINQRNSQEYSDRARCKNQLHDWSGALADYDRAIELNPRNPWLYRSRGHVKTELGDINGAAADHQKYDEMRPKHK